MYGGDGYIDGAGDTTTLDPLYLQSSASIAPVLLYDLTQQSNYTLCNFTEFNSQTLVLSDIDFTGDFQNAVSGSGSTKIPSYFNRSDISAASDGLVIYQFCYCRISFYSDLINTFMENAGGTGPGTNPVQGFAQTNSNFLSYIYPTDAGIPFNLGAMLSTYDDQSRWSFNGHRYLNICGSAVLPGIMGLQLLSMNDGSPQNEAFLQVLGFVNESLETIWEPELGFIRPIEGLYYDRSEDALAFSSEAFCYSNETPELYRSCAGWYYKSSPYFDASDPYDCTAFVSNLPSYSLNFIPGGVAVFETQCPNYLVAPSSNNANIVNAFPAITPSLFHLARGAADKESDRPYSIAMVANDVFVTYADPLSNLEHPLLLPYGPVLGINPYNMHSCFPVGINAGQDHWSAFQDFNTNFYNLTSGLGTAPRNSMPVSQALEYKNLLLCNNTTAEGQPNANGFNGLAGKWLQVSGGFNFAQMQYNNRVDYDINSGVNYHLDVTSNLPNSSVRIVNALNSSLLSRVGTNNAKTYDVLTQSSLLNQILSMSTLVVPTYYPWNPVTRTRPLVSELAVYDQANPDDYDYANPLEPAQWSIYSMFEVSQPGAFTIPTNFYAAQKHTWQRVPRAGRIHCDQIATWYFNACPNMNDRGINGMPTKSEVVHLGDLYQSHDLPSPFANDLRKMGHESDVIGFVMNFSLASKFVLASQSSIVANTPVGSNYTNLTTSSENRTRLGVQNIVQFSSQDQSDPQQQTNPVSSIYAASANPALFASTGFLIVDVNGISFNIGGLSIINGRSSRTQIVCPITQGADEIDTVAFTYPGIFNVPAQTLTAFTCTFLSEDFTRVSNVDGVHIYLTFTPTGQPTPEQQAYLQGQSLLQATLANAPSESSLAPNSTIIGPNHTGPVNDSGPVRMPRGASRYNPISRPKSNLLTSAFDQPFQARRR